MFQLRPTNSPAPDEHLTDDERSIEEVMAELSKLPSDSSNIWINRGNKGVRGGWEFIDIRPVEGFDLDKLALDLQQTWGGGTYQLTWRADGQIVTRKTIHIAGAPKTPQANNTEPDPTERIFARLDSLRAPQSDNDLLKLILTQREADAGRQAQLLSTVLTAAIPGVIGLFTAMVSAGKGDTTEKMIGVLGPLLKPEAGGLKEMLQTMALMREFIGQGNTESGSDGSFFGEITKHALPVIAEAMKAANPGQAALPATPPPLAYGTPGAPIQGPMNVGTGNAPMGAIAPDFRPAPQVESADPIANLIRLVGPDVHFFASRGHDPDLAAEAVLDTLDRHHVSGETIDALVLRLSGTTDPFAELASLGLDLREHAIWAGAFLRALVEQYTGVASDPGPAGESEQPSTGSEGSEDNAATDAPARKGRGARPAG